MVYMAAISSQVLGQICAARFEPVVGIVVGRGVLDASEMERLAPLDAGAAAAAMPCAPFIARPRLGKRHREPHALAYNVGLAPAQKWRRESNLRQPVEARSAAWRRRR